MSVISTWELYVKNTVGKLHLPDPIPTFVARVRDAYDIELIELTETDLIPLADLPLQHRDPFDRALLAQSIARGLVFITPDAELRRYERARILW
ncbi:MAG: type II toxin-antitoxin system VapC family toxin [Candidatus Eremiobacteraeota bacterium]|nr:type II toxin-antitoxin system VapC family toxin [Candidatus Eremiobacteraeota bacterium]MBC5803118.1 type II toxin-antitoxin system VapC family toxin [Candidatus Eremiobacteraeota bacterium]MBC5823194.1 type II toxin-antitoxin system VapC family toxin [Candidatus Eremiobacteraeota bacterium]